MPNSLGSTATIEDTDVVQGTKAIKLMFVPPNYTLADRALDNWDANVGAAPGGKYTGSVQAKAYYADLFNRFTGSKMLVTNFKFRFPFLELLVLEMVFMIFCLSTFGQFYDAGYAWFNGEFMDWF